MDSTPPLVARAFRLLILAFGVVGLATSGSEAASDETLAETPPVAASAAPPGAASSAVTATASDAKLSPAEASAVENAVVKVFATIRRPDLSKPWTKSSPTAVTGSGVIIEGKRILTNAHVVLYASQIEVQANQSGDKLSATVEAIAPGIDLALLKLEDESFFDSRPPIVRANTLPEVTQTVMAYGYPTGGTSLSITKGIVSRIEFASYGYSVSGLRIQIDAAINPGNSGGPAISGDKMIGLAFSHLGNAQNIGYIIPTEEVNLFLADVADGKYDGKPSMFDDLQTLENPALRAFLGLKKEDHGVIVHQPFDDTPTYPLKQWDVITKIGDTPIDDEGMVRVSANLRVRFQYLVQHYAKDGKAPLTLIRAGATRQVELPVSSDRNLLLTSLKGGYPQYFVFGPLVLAEATADYADSAASNAAVMRYFSYTGTPLLTRRGDKPAFPGERLVVVPSPFFPHRLSKGYSNPVSRVVETINGTAVKNLEHAIELLRDSKERFVTFNFAGDGGEAIVLPRQECINATEEILSDNGVRSQGSPAAMRVWSQTAPQ